MVVFDIMHKDRFGGEINSNGIDTLSPEKVVVNYLAMVI